MANNILKYMAEDATPITGAGAVTKGLLYGVNSSGNPVLADQTTGPVAAFGFAVADLSSADGARGRPVGLCPRGVVDVDTSNIEGAAFTVGAIVYLYTAGKYTTTKPTTAAHLVQVIGTAISATKVACNIVQSPIVAQAAGNSNIGI